MIKNNNIIMSVTSALCFKLGVVRLKAVTDSFHCLHGGCLEISFLCAGGPSVGYTRGGGELLEGRSV